MKFAPLPRSATLAERLDRFSMPEPTSGCSLWLSTICKKTGYGQMSLQSRTRLAHRLAWEAANGAIPAGLVVRHRCDNRACVNPDHLLLGTQADNARDARERGGYRTGEAHPKTTLTTEQVQAIRANSRSSYALAAQYAVNASTIQRIRLGRSRRAG